MSLGPFFCKSCIISLPRDAVMLKESSELKLPRKETNELCINTSYNNIVVAIIIIILAF